MLFRLTIFVLLLLLVPPCLTAQPVFLGFDRNEYPGDQALAQLRKTFSYTSYWLNPPPGAAKNSWAGKRKLLQNAGFGFLVAFNGRLFAELKRLPSAPSVGQADGNAAVQAALAEGFPMGTIIFLDQEEGGRQLDAQKSYIYAFVDAVTQAGFGAGVYCSGIPFKEPDGTVIDTADDLRDHAGERNLVYWVTSDACPPSPGCSVAETVHPSTSGIAFAEIWQYAQSPRRPHYTAACKHTYSPDKNCYAPGTTIHIDIDVANSPDPSHGRR